jgi:hypothetical protein
MSDSGSPQNRSTCRSGARTMDLVRVTTLDSALLPAAVRAWAERDGDRGTLPGPQSRCGRVEPHGVVRVLLRVGGRFAGERDRRAGDRHQQRGRQHCRPRESPRGNARHSCLSGRPQWHALHCDGRAIPSRGRSTVRVRWACGRSSLLMRSASPSPTPQLRDVVASAGSGGHNSGELFSWWGRPRARGSCLGARPRDWRGCPPVRAQRPAHGSSGVREPGPRVRLEGLLGPPSS